MAIAQPSRLAAVVALPGVLAFILGIIAENKKVSVLQIYFRSLIGVLGSHFVQFCTIFH